MPIRRGASLEMFFWWLLSRCLLAIFVWWQQMPTGDLRYYERGLAAEQAGEKALTEYPDLLVWPLRLVYHFTGQGEPFTFGFAFVILLFDATFCLLLARRGSFAPLAFWLVVSLIIAPVYVRRLDAFPGLLVGFAALWLGSRRTLSGVMVGLAGAAKLWPLTLAAGLVGPWRKKKTWLGLAGFFGGLAAVASLTIATRGIDRLFSPLGFQNDRGLQSEAMLATPLVWLARFFPDMWSINYAASNSYEVFGPGVGALLMLSSLLTLACLLWGMWMTVRWLFGKTDIPVNTISYFWLALALAIVMSSRVFSPQYLIWFLPLIATIIAVDMPQAKRLSSLAIACAAFTTLLYPLLFDSFVQSEVPGLLALITLSARNLLMLTLLIFALRRSGANLRSARARASQS